MLVVFSIVHKPKYTSQKNWRFPSGTTVGRREWNILKYWTQLYKPFTATERIEDPHQKAFLGNRWYQTCEWIRIEIKMPVTARRTFAGDHPTHIPTTRNRGHSVIWNLEYHRIHLGGGSDRSLRGAKFSYLFQHLSRWGCVVTFWLTLPHREQCCTEGVYRGPITLHRVN